MTTISYKDIDIDDLEFNTPERLGNSYMCNLYHNDNLIYVQSPILNITKINKSIDDNEEDNYIEVESDNKEFIDFLLEMDENCVKCTFNNSENWFKKDIPYEAIDNMYKERDVYEEESKYSTKFRIPVLNNKVQCNIYNNDKEIIDIDDLNNENNKNIIMILHFKGLKILKESFYLDCYINQIKVVNVNKYNILNEYSIIESEINSDIDESIVSDEILEVLEQEKIEKERLDNLEKERLKRLEKEKLEKLEQINKLKEELNNLN
uniref:Uncharacterized protein n=1 Tax=viral metagenome TaxID=1070528 RepID=A0A6C0C800_9ZZZZ